ncbi:hypothetical protein I7I48_11857 [Histoplasma ohiense]|nr:hypothetical protein I7I48_11857 [Histoplasma ohiense (nom. inval.)]
MRADLAICPSKTELRFPALRFILTRRQAELNSFFSQSEVNERECHLQFPILVLFVTFNSDSAQLSNSKICSSVGYGVRAVRSEPSILDFI